MSTMTPDTTTDVATFRGRSLEELLPQIREQFGPDAIVLRQRDGLVGGIGGFFQQRFVEVDAMSGPAHPPPRRHARIDTYDDEPAVPEPETSATPDSFAALLAAAVPIEPAALDAPPPTPAPTPTPTPTPTPALTHELTAGGMSHAFAAKLLADAEAHELPFTDGDVREAARRALARRLPTSLPHRAGGLAVAFAGAGSTACADALASAYSRAGRDARAVAALDTAHTLLQRGHPDAVLAVGLPPVAAERTEVAALAARVATLQLDELVAVVPADLDLPSARALLDRLSPLSPTALVLLLDARAPGVGAVLELACTTRLPILYVQRDADIAPADPTTLAERLLP